MYRLNGLPYTLNVWVYERASVINNEIVVKEENGIPRICNWKVVGAKPKFEMFMETIFTENDCSNIQLTPEEIRSLDLPDNSHVPPIQSDSSNVNNEEVQPEEVPGFEDFSSKPPEQLLKRSTRDDNKRALDNKIGALEALIKENHAELLKVVGAKDNKTEKVFCVKLIFWIMKDIRGVSSPHIVDDSVEKEVGKQKGSEENVAKDDGSDTIQQDIKKHASNPVVVDTSLPVKELAPNLDTKTPTQHNIMPSKIMQSPYLTSFGSSLMQEFLEWIQKRLLKSHANKKPSEDKYRGKYALFGFAHMDFVVAFPVDKNWFYTMSHPMKCWTDQSDYLRNRYATLLWKYGMDKAKAGYVSDNDDPTRPKSDYTSPAEDGLINVE
ncbi:hypothetical protein H5410_028288 [Solanum commersonii]|uniref:Ulp1 protease family, C-terminal catalytic domain containing protein n=1 Tax=Solanum commersonii TaxID=4109 RepID=A0A9J5Z5Q7_SOLCO|nr:hypothetical protein H5410_028288 [Solanum commersonii]